MAPGPGTAAESVRPPALSIRWIIGFVIVTAAFYGLLAATSDLSHLRLDAGPTSALAIALALCLVLLGYGLRAVRWHLYLRSYGHDLTLRASGLSFLSGFALGLTPGKLGELVKTYYLHTYAKVPYPRSMAAAIVERAFDALALALILAIGLLWVPQLGPLPGLALLLVLLAGFFLLRTSIFVRACLRGLGRLPGIRRAVPLLGETYERIIPLLRPARAAYGLGLGLAAWCFEPVAMWFIARSFGIDIGLAECGVAFAAASLGGILTFIPGGIGATEGGMIGLLLLFGQDLPSATALALATRLATLWFGFAVGLVAVSRIRTIDPMHRRKSVRERIRSILAWFDDADEARGRGVGDGAKPALANSNRRGPAWSWKADSILAGILALTALILRWPHLSRYFWAWDGILFGLAVEDYDINAARPHAPGFPLYVMLARISHWFIHDMNRSLVLLSLASSIIGVILVYAFARELASRRVAFASAGLFLVAPIFFFHSLIALSYVVEVPMSVAVAWAAWRVRTRGSLASAAALGIAWAAALGLRQSILFTLSPLAAFALLDPYPRTGRAFQRIGVAAASALVTGLVWFVPMARDTGLGRWWQLSQFQSRGIVFKHAFWNEGWPAVEQHGRHLVEYLRFERYLLPLLGLAVAVLVVSTVRRRAMTRPTKHARKVAAHLALWIVPGLLFHLLVYSGHWSEHDGYMLVFLPALYIAFSLVVDASLRTIEVRFPPVRGRAWTVFAVLLLLSPAPFLANAALHEADARVRPHDEWVEGLGALKDWYDRNTTILVSSSSWLWTKWYFPDWQVRTYFEERNETARRYGFLAAHDHADEIPFYDSVELWPNFPRHPIPANVTTIVLVDGGFLRPLLPADIQPVRRLTPSGHEIYEFAPDPGRATIEDYFTG